MKQSAYIVMLVWGLFACKTSEKTTTTKSKNTTSTNVLPFQTVGIECIQNRYLHKDSNYVTVFIRVDLYKERASQVDFREFGSRYTLNYVFYPDFASRERLGYGNVPLDEQNVSQTGPKQFLIKFDVKKPTNHSNGVMLAEFVEVGTTKKLLTELVVRFKNPRLADRFALFEKRGRYPLFRNYVNVNDTVMLRDLGNTRNQMYLYYYNHDFDAAASPMNLSPKTSAKNMTIDARIKINVSGPVTFRNEGLYLMLEDTTDTYGIGIVVKNKRFPKFTYPQELAEPVMYVSQNQEIAELNNSKEQKKALDRYWLNLSNGNTEAAKRNIKSFYERVEDANRLFTTYKEGWKTDKGMIHIVMGPPDKVVKSKDREVWVYGQRANFSEINFTFNRRPNQFTEDHYELQRYVEYQPIWYPMVEAWRSGTIR